MALLIKENLKICDAMFTECIQLLCTCCRIKIHFASKNLF